jgi:antitoxin HigA-1
MFVKDGLPAIHPGVFLQEILDELELSQRALANTVGVSPRRISDVVRESRPVTAELALLFAKAFGQTPEYWMNLQVTYDLKTTTAAIAEKVLQVQQLPTSWDEQIAADIAEGKLDTLAEEAAADFRHGKVKPL